MELHAVALIAVLVFAFAMISKRASESVLTAPMFFVACGVLLGAGGLGVLHLDVGTEGVTLLAEATLVFVLFVDAAKVDTRKLVRQLGLPSRLLGIGMPLQILLGMGLAKLLLPELSWWQCGLLSSILAPTDAALGQAVVSSDDVPEEVRQSLSVESGLNDGIALPLVTIFLATCLTLEQQLPTSHWVEFTAKQIGFGALGGVVVGALGALGIDAASRRGFIEAEFRSIATLAVAVLSYAGAHALEGNGFIAAFVAGLVFGRIAQSDMTHLYDFAEEEGQLLGLLTFLVFGAALLPEALGEAGPQVILYAVLSLTVIRMVPVAAALLGSGQGAARVAFMGWFGPRGLASILFALLVVDASELEQKGLIVATVFATVALSVVLHGLTAQPLSKRLGAGGEGA